VLDVGNGQVVSSTNALTISFECGIVDKDVQTSFDTNLDKRSSNVGSFVYLLEATDMTTQNSGIDWS